MLSATGLVCRRGNRPIFSGIDFALQAGEVLQVQGANGAGKTSLLRMLCGLLPAAEGEVRWRGEPIGHLGKRYHGELVFLGHASGVKDELSGVENLCISARLAGDNGDNRSAREALRRMGLGGREDLPAKVLSQGQKRRVALARLLLTRKPLWLLDEPLASLDHAAIALLEECIEGHLAKGGMAVLTTHQEIRTAPGHTRQLRLG